MSSRDADEYGLNEVDDFAAKREQVLLDNSSMKNRRRENSGDDEEDDEEEVMSMTDESSEEEEEEELDGEKAYRQVFGRKLDISEPNEEDEATAMLDNENAWGTTKNEYYGADEIEDDEDAKEIEKEALRQQKKHLQSLNMDDYLDDELDEEWTKDAKAFDVSEFKDSIKQTNDNNLSTKDITSMDSEAKAEYLKTMFPEYIPLSKELTRLSDILNILKLEQNSESKKLKFLALSSYLATVTSYFGVLLHELKTNDDFVSMKDHPVMEAILTSKEVWRQAEELPDDEDFDQTEQIQSGDEVMDGDDIEELDHDMLSNIPIEQDDVEDENISGSDEDENDEESEDEADLDDFEEYVVQSRISKDKNNSNKTSEEKADDYLESEMNEVDAQEKKNRRRTLRFYTSKIDQQANKKADRLGGDEDIPYKERLFERQQRLMEEARKRGLHDKNGASLDDNDYDSQEEAIAKSINNDSTINYYKQIQKEREQRKSDRKTAHKTAVIAAREGKLAEAIEAVGENGKRAINYQILKNKGLTPKRKKDNRNSRVKKRKKYEQAKKKLKSVRAVYSGGQSGVYEGEKTGIKKNLIRSVKFKN
ncbi:similar to Saccharomyces cerevisiae YDL153C SAS10 Essential subunit of U3-containing Small Subunit (SSU) processome complex [Maudiozyma saulgeensis]|uniref:Similar to Saccharomyces cerevisiae YDL153C SAS10 Essential subunit of U3-containing Small Subunit (SSU) processome complex n=1 Tax=Maudiozyma saulgeensis TaxID=1789683 RepID=A0A1X7QYJ7_9SACH|nr:similar to Saccharomyces cerevisiae YDL153C SAS10 Essential subunit of U3-containing Small Subunit (SSU) processome complex [Kazachstania saulgeensis]